MDKSAIFSPQSMEENRIREEAYRKGLTHGVEMVRLIAAKYKLSERFMRELHLACEISMKYRMNHLIGTSLMDDILKEINAAMKTKTAKG